MASDGLSRVHNARNATLREGTARGRLATFAPGEGIDSVAASEEVGVGDLNSRRVMLESRPNEQQLSWLRDLAARTKVEQDLNESELGSIDIFVGEDHYSRAIQMEHWVRSKTNWYWRPLWALDVLDAAVGAWPEGATHEVYGHAATEYSGEIDPGALKRIDRHWQKVLGRRGKGRLRLHVWLDQHDHALRVAWKLPARQRKHEPSWYLSEFWDFGVPAAIDAPQPELVRSPATLREIIRDARAMRKAANS